MPRSSNTSLHQTLIGAGAIVVAAAMAYGAVSIPSSTGYSGIGPNFVPWAVAAALLVCGAWLVWEARTGGFREMEEPSGAARGDWRAFAWISAGVLANAALITTIGFVLSCALCFTLAVRGLRGAEGRPSGGVRQTIIDAATGLTISAPVFWLFTKVLSINLPGITGTGWI
ncbi:tripartite tricarboxylate transporter TctB family protein [Piscinibacter sp.]|uniref:tripartite tricarboxylate transporter TctB family protein n=1 Tax=Piscinibacter sp. TaxID=1903157 RepID=UPI002CC8F622|nr:tripartite tricarboxylate transporter TctB family protein [Albitalea sp.]HUG26023.1 tripartite tricarboxylate transporter TctB family protein [Albitalea sp.]